MRRKSTTPKKKRRDSDLLSDIIHAAQLAQSFVQGISEEAFLKDLKTQAALCRQLEIIGEAANRLTKKCRDSIPSVSWKDIIGMRNILIHVYEGIDVLEVWDTVNRDLPSLIAAVAPMLSKQK